MYHKSAADGDLVLYFLLPRGSKVQMRNEVPRVSAIWFCTFSSRVVQKYKYETKYQGVRRSGFVLSSPAWFKSTKTKRSIKGLRDPVLYSPELGRRKQADWRTKPIIVPSSPQSLRLTIPDPSTILTFGRIKPCQTMSPKRCFYYDAKERL